MAKKKKPTLFDRIFGTTPTSPRSGPAGGKSLSDQLAEQGKRAGGAAGAASRKRRKKKK